MLRMLATATSVRDMSLQKVWLIGPVAVASQPVSDEWGAGMLFVVATRREHRDTVLVDHHNIRLTQVADELEIGTEVLIEGQLVFDQESRRHVVLADQVMTLSSPPHSDSRGLATTTHQSPTAHVRSGHWRRLRVGMPDERLVWVRESQVGGRVPSR